MREMSREEKKRKLEEGEVMVKGGYDILINHI